MSFLIFRFVTASCGSLFLSVTVPWRDWLEFVSKNAWIPVALIIAIGISLTLICLRRWIHAVLRHLESIQVGINALTIDVSETKVTVSNIKHTLEEQITELEKSIRRQADRQDLSYQALSEDLKSASTANQIPGPVTMPSDGDETDLFPSSVANYLRYAEQNNLTRTEAKSDVLRSGNLMSSDEGHFIVIHDAISKNEDVAVPHVIRFSSNEEFSIYFRGYFDCDAPSAGEVWITRPAIVQTDEIVGGWRLVKKGQLEVK